MAQIKILDNEFSTVWCYPEKKIVHHQIHKFIKGEMLKEMFLSGYTALKNYHATKWLSDDRNNNALAPEDAQWAQDVWFPQTKNAGWKFWAIVLPEKAIGQLNMKRFIKIYSDLGITAQIFSDPDDAMKWLESCA